MDALLPEEIGAIRDTVNKFMATEVNARMNAVEASGQFPRDLVKKAGEAGLYGALFPESVGGTNLGYLASAIVSEELARNDVRFAACYNQQASTCPFCIYAAGTPESASGTSATHCTAPLLLRRAASPRRGAWRLATSARSKRTSATWNSRRAWAASSSWRSS